MFNFAYLGCSLALLALHTPSIQDVREWSLVRLRASWTTGRRDVFFAYLVYASLHIGCALVCNYVLDPAAMTHKNDIQSSVVVLSFVALGLFGFAVRACFTYQLPVAIILLGTLTLVLLGFLTPLCALMDLVSLVFFLPFLVVVACSLLAVCVSTAYHAVNSAVTVDGKGKTTPAAAGTVVNENA